MSCNNRLQIYPSACSGVNDFWKEKYERDARKYWDIFYKRHKDKFFLDRHYLDKEWSCYLDTTETKVILEAGCGAGNSLFPLLALYPNIFFHACDFSPRAIDLIKAHKDFKEGQINAFTCDLTYDDLTGKISPSSVDVVTMIFVLSAVSPEKMPLVLQKIKNVLKPNGRVLFRDYATGDLAEERLKIKDQKISENFYARSDGTRAFYFSEDYLTSLFRGNGFGVGEVKVHYKQVENWARDLVMNRRWIQAVFFQSHSSDNGSNLSEKFGTSSCGTNEAPSHDRSSPRGVATVTEVDLSESIAADMFGLSQLNDEVGWQLLDWCKL